MKRIMEAVLGHVDSSYINSGYLLCVYLYIRLHVCGCVPECLRMQIHLNGIQIWMFLTQNTVGYW